jgi:adenosylhomocysteinase
MTHDIRSLELADRGHQRIAWAARNMPVLRQVAEEFSARQPLAGRRIAAALHITTETAVLMRALQAGGAQIALCASNPLSTRDDVCAALVTDGMSVYAHHGEDLATYERHLEQTLAIDPHLVMDDGADLIVALHRRASCGSTYLGIEETTTGVTRVRAMAAAGDLRFAVIVVNDTPTKHFFDNRYGTGQNTIDGILRSTNMLLAGATAVVAGYGWCGRGIALRLRGMGARVLVCEVNAIRALEAVMEGYQVTTMAEAAPLGDLFVTATGMVGIIRTEHIEVMKDGAILANSGHFDVEIDVAGLRRMALGSRPGRDHMTEFQLPSGRSVFLLGEGRLIGQAAAEASPAAVMDMSFADQALSTAYLFEHGHTLAPGVYDVPLEIDERVAQLKLAALGVTLDTLNDQQLQYQRDWRVGTA